MQTYLYIHGVCAILAIIIHMIRYQLMAFTARRYNLTISSYKTYRPLMEQYLLHVGIRSIIEDVCDDGKALTIWAIIFGPLSLLITIGLLCLDDRQSRQTTIANLSWIRKKKILRIAQKMGLRSE